LELSSQGQGAPELRVPLPDSDERQAVASLLWQVSDGEFEVEEKQGRWLIARSAQVSLRVRFLRSEVPVRDAPLEVLEAVNALLERPPAEWVEGARARSLTARVVHGLRWEGHVARLTTWAEVQLPGETPTWVAVDPTSGHLGLAHALRLGTAPPQARRGALPVRLLVRASVRRDEGSPE
jgi:hypothetical protein